MSNACSKCDYSKVCFESTEKDGFEHCSTQAKLDSLRKKIKKLKTEKQKVIESGRF